MDAHQNRCPDCGSPLGTDPGPRCRRCGLPLTGPQAVELWQLDRALAELSARRAGLLVRRGVLLAALRAQGTPTAPVAAAGIPAGGAPGGMPWGAAPDGRPWGAPRPDAPAPSVQTVLLVLGGVLTSVAGLVFTLVNWGHLGVAGRTAVLAAATALAFTAHRALRPRLAATAETAAAIGLALVLLDCYAARAADIGGLHGVPGDAYGTAVTALVGAAAWAYGHRAGSTVLRAGALLLAQCAVPLAAAATGAGRAGWGTVLVAGAALDLALALALHRAARPLPAFARAAAAAAAVWSAVGTAVAGSAVLAVGPHAAYPPVLRACVPLGLLVLLSAFAARRPELPHPARVLAGTLSGVALVAVAAGAPRIALPATWTVAAHAVPAAALAIAALLRLKSSARDVRRDPLLTGAAAAGLAVLSAALLQVLPDLLRALAEPVRQAVTTSPETADGWHVVPQAPAVTALVALTATAAALFLSADRYTANRPAGTGGSPAGPLSDGPARRPTSGGGVGGLVPGTASGGERDADVPGGKGSSGGGAPGAGTSVGGDAGGPVSDGRGGGPALQAESGGEQDANAPGGSGSSGESAPPGRPVSGGGVGGVAPGGERDANAPGGSGSSGGGAPGAGTSVGGPAGRPVSGGRGGGPASDAESGGERDADAPGGSGSSGGGAPGAGTSVGGHAGGPVSGGRGGGPASDAESDGEQDANATGGSGSSRGGAPAGPQLSGRRGDGSRPGAATADRHDASVAADNAPARGGTSGAHPGDEAAFGHPVADGARVQPGPLGFFGPPLPPGPPLGAWRAQPAAETGLFAWVAAVVVAVVAGVVALALAPVAAGLPYGVALAAAWLPAPVAAVLLARRPDAETVPRVCAVVVPAALALLWSLPHDAAALTVWGATASLGAGLAAALRGSGTRRIADGAAAFTLIALGVEAARAGMVAELPPHLAAFAVLGVAVASLPVAARLRSAAFEATGYGVGAAALLMTVPHRDAASVALAVAGVAALGVALRAARRGPAAVTATLLLAASSWLRLAAAGVTAPEPYTVPVAVAALVLGHLRRRRFPATGSWQAYGPGLGLALLPALGAAWVDVHWPRPLLLGAAALAVTLTGARHRLRAPLLLGGAVLTVDAVHELAPTIAQSLGLLPRWAPLAAAGLVLLFLGATYERRLADGRRLRDRLRRLT